MNNAQFDTCILSNKFINFAEYNVMYLLLFCPRDIMQITQEEHHNLQYIFLMFETRNTTSDIEQIVLH